MAQLGKSLFRTLIIAITCCFLIDSAAQAAWPLAGQIDLSSGFGDYRSGRFHAGLDLRTGGAPGKQMKAPVSGYISRIRMSYTGYGKGLYMVGDDGYTYVFGHLQGFNPELEKLVKSRQDQARRYYVDLEFPKDSLRVKEGALLAYTGQTGAGAPHLHFEKRAPNNLPLNPLSHGYKLNDKVRPVFERIGFQLTDDHSLFSDGSRKVFYSVRGTGKAGSYKLDTVLYFNSPFGVMADCFDKMRDAGMRQAVYKLQVYVDETQYYEVRLDTISYDETTSATLVYDFSEAADGEPRVRRLYHRNGNEYAGSMAFGLGHGIIGREDNLSFGPHSLRIVAEDAFGNRSELNAAFVWGPASDLRVYDSIVVVDDSTKDYFFTTHSAYEKLGITTANVYFNRGDRWYAIPRSSITTTESGGVKVRVIGDSQERAIFRFQYTTKEKCQIADFPFNGFATRGILPPAISYELTDDGMIVRGELVGRTGYYAQVELFDGDSLLGTEKLRQFSSMNLYAFFIPPKPEYQKITRLQLRFQSELGVEPKVLDSLDIVAAGIVDTTRLSVDNAFEFMVEKSDLFAPCYIDLRKLVVEQRGALQLASDYYQIGPEDLLLKAPVTVRAMSIGSHPQPKQLGICRLDKAADKWIWLGSENETVNRMRATSTRGGSYAIVIDREAPRISGLNIPTNKPISDRMPEITFTLSDNLSGFEDDRNITLKLDGVWLIPEYDPETKNCRTTPLKPLEAGKHSLTIDVTDRAGNPAQKTFTFEVAGGKTSTKKGK